MWWQRWLLFTLYLVLSTLILVLVYYYNDFAASTELGKPVSVNCQMSWRNIPGLAKFHKTEVGYISLSRRLQVRSRAHFDVSRLWADALGRPGGEIV